MRKWLPKEMEWFLAEPIQQFTLANGDGPSVWVNTVLVKANSIEQAYEKALKFGEAYNEKYVNSDGIEVTASFRGLRNLYLIYDQLEDGAELLYEEFDEISEEEIAEMVKPKEQLAVFRQHSGEVTGPASSIREGEPQ
jgi:hypothetical protein